MPDQDATSKETTTAEQREATTAHEPDRAPTPEEERTAEEVAKGVNLDEVRKHEEEMLDKGAHVEGEGAIDPT